MNIIFLKNEKQIFPLSVDVVFYSSIKRLFCSNFLPLFLDVLRTNKAVLLLEFDDSNLVKRLIADCKVNHNLIAIIRTPDLVSNAILNHYKSIEFAEIISNKINSKKIMMPSSGFFEQYLIKAFKQKYNSVIINPLIHIATKNHLDGEIYTNLVLSNKLFPSWIPKKLRYFLSVFRRRLAHVCHFIILPVLLLQRPFLGVNSIYLINDARSSTYDQVTVFRKRDFLKIINDVPVKSQRKYQIIEHPLSDKAKAITYFNYYFDIDFERQNDKAILFLVNFDEYSNFTNDQFELIKLNRILEDRIELLSKITRKFATIIVYIKCHPMSVESPMYNYVKNTFESIKNVVWCDPFERAEKFMANCIMHIYTPPGSTLIGLSSIFSDRKKIIYYDKFFEFRGDIGGEFENVITANTHNEIIIAVNALNECKSQNLKI